MRYFGGKSRLAKKFAPVIAAALIERGGRFVEPFVGGFNVVPALGEAVVEATCSDIHAGLINMYRELRDGRFRPPEFCSEEMYAQLKRMKQNDPLSTFVSFGCSFGGREWGSYGRNKREGGSTLCEQAHRGLLKKATHMDKVLFLSTDYRRLKVPERSVIYADPPYKGTRGYRTGSFDHDEFYEWCERMFIAGHRVFVSEFTIPDRPGWAPVWQIDRRLMQSDRVRTDYLIEVQFPWMQGGTDG